MSALQGADDEAGIRLETCQPITPTTPSPGDLPLEIWKTTHHSIFPNHCETSKQFLSLWTNGDITVFPPLIFIMSTMPLSMSALSPARLRVSFVRIPLASKVLLAIIGLFWVANLLLGVQEWAQLVPDKIGVLSGGMSCDRDLWARDSDADQHLL
jgi:hypothetical protein